MKIYTKTGDKGETSLYDGQRIKKDSTRVESYGTIDELNSHIGLAKNFVEDKELYNLLCTIQRKLFDVGAELATKDKAKLKVSIKKEDVEFIEKNIDKFMKRIEQPDHFIIPGTNKTAGLLHIARTVCRRAERRIISLSEVDFVNPNLLKFVNRLSDLLYTLAVYSEDNLNKVEF
ncbi:cob(I)yrinic acid a,c-diamide adenosyltransferase [Thermohalobacter berrensis]|uniref:Corrinoid adenosyltransferase n=1 Tax=Thermohalobacter berrensis TaxID=99594 RepID=A0A419T8P9_9FIRM|nr:cob(I)yrinic acid a,c-diamide adenosyltransferase [Thermohalobacter berrensis]RKD33930.1 ATP:cob(I)alamin adenosyltransferase [Thermohalobacter berrensis]